MVLNPASQTIPSVLSRWFEAFKGDVLSGRISLEELIEVADADMRAEFPHELCPLCTRHPVRRGAQGYREGVCAVCWLQHLRDAHLEELARLEAKRDYDVSKKALQRERERQGVTAPKTRRSYGRNWPSTDEPLPFAYCESCGTAFRQHTDEDAALCPECLERKEKRHG